MSDSYYDEFDEIGAILRRRAAPRKAASVPARRGNPQQAARASRALPPPSYMTGAPQAGRGAEFPLGFGTFNFTDASALSCILKATPQRRGKPKRLTVTAQGTALGLGLLSVADIKIGTISQLMSADPIPADMFRYDAVGTELSVAEVGPGMEAYILLTLSVQPTAGLILSVGAAFICDALD